MTYFSKFIHRAMLVGLLASLISACGGGGGSGNTNVNPIALNNWMAVTVDSGVSGNAVNQLFASVTVCQPGNKSQCQTIEHILVDTGSTGLRIFSSALPTALNLPKSIAPSGFPLLNCVQFIDNTYAWGPVVKADLVLGGKTAASVPIQVMADPAYNSPNSLCSSRGHATQITAAAALGANGILGLGLFKEDCGADCVSHSYNGSYFTCTTAACNDTVVSTADIYNQLKHPVPLFDSDSNGLLVDLPTVPVAGATHLDGRVIFGVNTQTNNQITAAQILTTDAFGFITTKFAGQSLNRSFIDSGSNGLFFDSASLPFCSSQSLAYGFYCPSVSINLSATLMGANAQTASVDFSVSNASTLIANRLLAVLPTLSGPIGYAQTFDWGLPFFYGRRVFFGIDGQASTKDNGPFYAF